MTDEERFRIIKEKGHYDGKKEYHDPRVPIPVYDTAALGFVEVICENCGKKAIVNNPNQRTLSVTECPDCRKMGSFENKSNEIKPENLPYALYPNGIKSFEEWQAYLEKNGPDLVLNGRPKNGIW